MTVHLQHLDGSSSQDSSDAALVELLAEVAQIDDEHPDVAVTHESGWTLLAFERGSVVWENVESDEQPRHMTGAPRAKILQLWAQLREGNLEAIEAEPWIRGYPPR